MWIGIYIMRLKEWKRRAVVGKNVSPIHIRKGRRTKEAFMRLK